MDRLSFWGQTASPDDHGHVVVSGVGFKFGPDGNFDTVSC